MCWSKGVYQATRYTRSIPYSECRPDYLCKLADVDNCRSVRSAEAHMHSVGEIGVEIQQTKDALFKSLAFRCHVAQKTVDALWVADDACSLKRQVQSLCMLADTSPMEVDYDYCECELVSFNPFLVFALTVCTRSSSNGLVLVRYQNTRHH